MPNSADRLVLVNAEALVDGTGNPALNGVQVEIRRKHFGEIGTPSRSNPEGTMVLDASGLFLMPGLIDAHTHLGHAFESSVLRDVGSLSVAEVAAEIIVNLELALDAGVTSARELGGLDGGMARAVERGLVRGPRLFPSGPAIAQTGGHGTYLGQFPLTDSHFRVPGLLERTQVADGPDAVRRAARLAFRRGATQIKVYASGGILSEGDSITDSQFSVEELASAVGEAKARGTYVTAHAHSISALHNGLAAGIRCFEHATFLDEESADAIAKARGAIVPTMSVIHVMEERAAEWGIPQEMLKRLDGVESAMTDAIRLAHAKGILIGSGSDLLGPRQRGRGMEIGLKARLIGAMNAIVSGTANNARIMGIYDQLGTVEPGKVADIIGVRFDPLERPDALADAQNVVLVVKDGQVVKDDEGRSN